MSDTDSQKQAEQPEDFQGDPRKLRRRWLTEIGLASKTEDKWRKKSEDIIKLYRAGKGKANAFNILYANTDTYRPAIYNSQPKPDVRRRYDDADPVGYAVSQVLDRALQFTIDTCQLDETVNLCLLDYLLPGRCVSRVRYVPSLIESPEGMGYSANEFTVPASSDGKNVTHYFCHTWANEVFDGMVKGLGEGTLPTADLEAAGLTLKKYIAALSRLIVSCQDGADPQTHVDEVLTAAGLVRI